MVVNKDLIRNVAIIAHVDHGKTTLVDGLLKQSHTFRDNQAEMSQTLIMDSMDQEHERGITITAKQTCVYYNAIKLTLLILRVTQISLAKLSVHLIWQMGFY